MAERIPLIEFDYDELGKWLADLGQPSYRTDQVYRWIYRSLAVGFDEMTNLPASLRADLSKLAILRTLTPVGEQVSADGLTRKVLFQLRDGEAIEAVLMFYEGRRTVCISTQVGCPIGCPFCATGQAGFARDLSAGEIVEQVLHFARELKASRQSLTNVVIMGMGEPLLNYEATWAAIERLNDKRGFGLGARRITISTAGDVPGIRRLAEADREVGLAISLHAPNDQLRDKLVPLNRRYPLHELLAACRYYLGKTHRRLTFEYALMDGINDSNALAEETADLLQGLLCHVNLIALNPTPDCSYQPSPRKRVAAFQRILTARGVPATVRLGRGLDIAAGCGQLRGQVRARGQRTKR